MSSVPLIRSDVDGRDVRHSWAEGLPAQLSSVLLWPFRVMRARTELAKVARMSDHELRDIGLIRSDIRNATALPLEEDPTRFLAWTARERHRAARTRRP